jgi:DNA-directed RNA polymerase subunit RPC12/RpoP
MFDKIGKIISEKGLKPSDCAYHTLRNLENNGKIRILVIKGETTAHTEYICPKCGNYGYIIKDWKRPFNIKCEKCGSLIRVSKLKTKKT